MSQDKIVKNILDNYSSDNPGTKANIARILNSGDLRGTGNMLILPVDQGFEHGPNMSFAQNPAAYDPEYHIKLAIEAGLNAYAAPLGMLEAVAGKYAGEIPLILKMNSANSLMPKNCDPTQAITARIDDALRLGCSAVGFTIYPGSGAAYDMIEQASEMVYEAKNAGLAAVIWSYPRGDGIGENMQTALDVTCYAAHIAALIGAHIIKVKLPSSAIQNKNLEQAYKDLDFSELKSRVSHVMQSAFANKLLVVFSGGASKNNEQELYDEVRAIKSGGGNGSIIGRNVFQRNRADAMLMLDQIKKIYFAK